MPGVQFHASFHSHSAEARATTTAGAMARFGREVEKVRSEMKQLAAAQPVAPEIVLPELPEVTLPYLPEVTVPDIGGNRGGSVNAKA
ncbi:MAG: hypothetical protein O2807_07225 [bacterium]|nr:hypothetical protein [bacterium]